MIRLGLSSGLLHSSATSNALSVDAFKPNNAGAVCVRSHPDNARALCVR